MIRKRSITIAGHPTSVSLEDAFWDALGEIAAERGMSISDLVSETDILPRGGGLSSALRLLVLNHYRTGAKAKSGSSRSPRS
jgi:predicted DNA-binding ribbon-helix-helix protein